MNILYIGEAGEIGAKLVNTLALTDTLAAVFSEKPEYETNCDILAPSADLSEVIRERGIDTVILKEDPDATVKELEQLLSHVADNTGCRLFYIREKSFFRRREIRPDASLRICEGLARDCGVKTVLISCSCLYSQERIPQYTEEVLRQINRRNELDPRGAEKEICDCLHIDDFCTAANSIIHTESEQDFEAIELQSAYPFMLSSFIDNVTQRYGEVSVLPYLDEQHEYTYTAYQSDEWTPKHGFLDELPIQLDESETRRRSLQKNRRKKGVNLALKLGAFGIVFLLAELYTRFIAVSSDLQFVDMRLLFVVVATLLLGKKYGVIAAALCSVASVTQSLLAGYRWYVLFYHVDNWIPIAVYFITAVLLGLYRDRHQRKEPDEETDF